MVSRIARSLLIAGLLFIPLAMTWAESTRAAVVAPAWIIYDVTNDQILDQEQMHRQVPIASVTKVMTGLLVVDHLSLDQYVTVVPGDLIGEAMIGLQSGDTVTVRTLLHGIMMRSGNDAAMALARAAGGSPHQESPHARSTFIAMMNQRAQQLGMHSTNFANPHGLDNPHHYSTAFDLSLLTRAVLERPELLEPFGAVSYSAEGFSFSHTNQLGWGTPYPGLIGGKTGWTTAAGRCLTAAIEDDDRTLIIVLLGSTTERQFPDAVELLDYGRSVPQPATTPERAAEAFEWWRLRTDAPVELGQVARSWLWGPAPVTEIRLEPYDDAIGGQRMVQYFDKGRMEINDPMALVTSGWYVTGGHLARELITGQQQVGDASFIERAPAQVTVAGDPGSFGPHYEDMQQLMSAVHLDQDGVITLFMESDGSVSNDSALARYEVGHSWPNVATGLPIASVFDSFLDQRGPVIHRGEISNRTVFEPRYALVGLPVTMPVWVRVPLSGVTTEVLVQCFERRCLTYTPSNPDGWRVELGNIGHHYLAWSESWAAPH